MHRIDVIEGIAYIRCSNKISHPHPPNKACSDCKLTVADLIRDTEGLTTELIEKTARSIATHDGGRSDDPTYLQLCHSLAVLMDIIPAIRHPRKLHI